MVTSKMVNQEVATTCTVINEHCLCSSHKADLLFFMQFIGDVPDKYLGELQFNSTKYSW